MKRVRCPKCDQYITFDETQYEAGQSLVFKCPDCGKEFGIRMGVSKLKNRQKDENPDENANEEGCGSVVVIENVFHYKQVIPLKMGDNVIGRYQKGNPANCTFETVDPSVDLTTAPSLSRETSTAVCAIPSRTTTATQAPLSTMWNSRPRNGASSTTAHSSPLVPRASSSEPPTAIRIQ